MVPLLHFQRGIFQDNSVLSAELLMIVSWAPLLRMPSEAVLCKLLDFYFSP